VSCIVGDIPRNCVLFTVMHAAVGVFGKGCSLLCAIVMTCCVGSLEVYYNW